MPPLRREILAVGITAALAGAARLVHHVSMTIHDDASAASRKVYDDAFTSKDAQIAALKGEVASLTVERDALQAQLAAANATITGLNAQIVQLNARIKELESGGVIPPPPTLPYDWSDTNPPWKTTDPTVLAKNIPLGVPILNLSTGGADFYANLNSTLTKRAVVKVPPAAAHRFTKFIPIGTSGKPDYAFAFWHSNLQGLLGPGAEQAAVEMAANSLTAPQLAALAALTNLQTNSMAMMRIDGSAASPTYLSGLTFRAADQQNLTATASTQTPAIKLPQPAPHHGISFYGGGNTGRISYCRFQGAGRAMTSSPPFEHGNVTSQYNSLMWDHCEFDSRRSPVLDPAQPKRVGVVMLNNETLSVFEDCWFRNSNVSRYAANDQNRDTKGTYILRRCKVELITTDRNTDPALHNGESLGGWTAASCLGFESTNASILIEDSILSVDSSVISSGQVPCHVQLTYVGGRGGDPQGGRIKIINTVFRNTGFPTLNGYLTMRIQPTTHWWTDGFDTTIEAYSLKHARLRPFVVTGIWPPSKVTLDSANVTLDSHYLIKSA